STAGVSARYKLDRGGAKPTLLCCLGYATGEERSAPDRGEQQDLVGGGCNRLRGMAEYLPHCARPARRERWLAWSLPPFSLGGVVVPSELGPNAGAVTRLRTANTVIQPRPPDAQLTRPGLRMGAPHHVPMEPQSYKRNEVLVLGAKPGTIRTLLARGWRRESGAAVHVERLLSNSEISLAVVDQLQLEFPEARFALNYVYRHAVGI